MYKKVIHKVRTHLQERKQRKSFAARTAGIRKAVKHAKKHDGLVVSRAVYLQTLEILAIFASQVEKSGGISPAVRTAMLSDTMVITQGFVDALVLGDPSLQMDEVKQRYVNARGRSQSRKARARMAIRQAIALLGPNAPPQLPRKNLPHAQQVAVRAVQSALTEARVSAAKRASA